MYPDVAETWHCCGLKAVLARGLLLSALLSCAACGRSGPNLADAGGTVTYQGNPVEGAMVTFANDLGPPAVGTTDSDGRFTFTTQGEPGAIIGEGGIAITAFDQTRPLNDAEMKGGISRQAILAMRKSKIPEKYGHPSTSELTATVTENPDENQFTFDLK